MNAEEIIKAISRAEEQERRRLYRRYETKISFTIASDVSAAAFAACKKVFLDELDKEDRERR